MTLTKAGAVLAAGILDAGGRNVCLSLASSGAGFVKSSAVAGVVIWAQHWYWYPMYHFLSLALAPTMLVGLNRELKMPTAFRAHCATRPSLFEYPKKTEEKKRVVTAVLSTSAKAQARAKRKEAAEKGDDKGEKGDMDVDGAGEAKGAKPEGDAAAAAGDAAAAAAPKDGDGAKADGAADGAAGEKDSEKDKPSEKKAPEPPAHLLPNPCRVTVAQRPHISFSGAQRYVPVHRSVRPSGVVMLLDNDPDAPEDVVLVETPSIDNDDDDAEPPEPFVWTPPAPAAAAAAPAAAAAAPAA